MRRLIARPATAVFTSPDEDDVTFVAQAAYISNEHDFPQTLEMHGDDEIRLIDIRDIDVDVQGRLTGTTAPLGLGMVVRATIEDDSVTLPSMPGYPLPVPVIIATLSGENMDTHIEALVEDDGYVSTLLLVTDLGLYMRYSSTWIALRDVGLIDGLNSMPVGDGAVDVYDAADELGQQVNVDGLPSDERDRASAGHLIVADSAPRTFLAKPVTASAMATLPVIDTLEQLTAAIDTADADETLRWYVEKRAQALGAEVHLPWTP